MNRIVYQLGLFLLLSISCYTVQAEKPLHQRLGKGDFETALEIFNLWEKQPIELQNILKESYAFLCADSLATIAELTRNRKFMDACRVAGITHLGGPILGDISETSVTVWIRTLKPSEVKVQLKINGKLKIFGPVVSTIESDLSALIQLKGLKAGEAYPYEILIDGEKAIIPETSIIRTISKNENLTIAFGSCWHRWGLGNPQMDVLRERKPSALLMIGDIAVQDRNNRIGLHRYDYLQRDLTKRWADFSATIPVYTSWDDHDFVGNDKAGLCEGISETDRSNIRTVFKQSWTNPQYGIEKDESGIFMHTRIGAVDVIFTDNRYFREQEMGSNNFLGKSQMDWLKKQLLKCKGDFIILSCGTMWSDFVSDGKDSWGKYDPEGREEIFNLIEDNHIKGVLLISGDRHGARGFTIPRESGYQFYEFGGACFGGRIGPPAKQEDWATQLYGIAAEYAFSEFEFNTSEKDPEVTFRLMNEYGNLIYELSLKQSELTPHKR